MAGGAQYRCLALRAARLEVRWPPAPARSNLQLGSAYLWGLQGALAGRYDHQEECQEPHGAPQRWTNRLRLAAGCAEEVLAPLLAAEVVCAGTAACCRGGMNNKLCPSRGS